jgi:membrane protease YdiL (CAAX protease family)
MLLLSVAVGFRWPRWEIALIPIGITIGLAVYFVVHGDWRVSPNGDNTAGLEFLAIVVIALFAEGAVFVGTLLRAAYERRRGEVPGSRRAVRGGAAVAVVSLSFLFALALLTSGLNMTTFLFGAFLVAAAWFVARRRSS